MPLGIFCVVVGSGEKVHFVAISDGFTDAPASYDWPTSGTPDKVEPDLTIPFVGAMVYERFSSKYSVGIISIGSYFEKLEQSPLTEHVVWSNGRCGF